MFVREDVPKFNKFLPEDKIDEWLAVANKAIEELLTDGADIIDAEIEAVLKANAMFGQKDGNGYHFSADSDPVCLSLAEVPSEASDKWQQVIPIGLTRSDKYGDIVITRTFCESMVKNQDSLKNTIPFLDTDHDRGEANGWLSDMRVGESGLEVKWDWTERGKDLVKARRYRYYSAEIWMVRDIDSGDYVYPVFVGCALTNSPVMKQLPNVELSDKGKSPADTDRETIQGGKGMNFAEVLKVIPQATDEERALLVRELGLAETATRVKELGESVKRLEGEKSVLEETNKDLSEKVKKLQGDSVARRKKEVIEAALSDGRILPKDKEKWEGRFDENPDFTETVLADLPKAVDYGSHGTGEGGSDRIVLSDEERETFDKLGLTEEDLETYGGVE